MPKSMPFLLRALSTKCCQLFFDNFKSQNHLTTRNNPTKKENQFLDSLYLVAETRLERATSGL